MAKKSDELLEILNSRLYLAEKFSEKWRKDVKKWLKDYNIETLDEVRHKDLSNKIQVPYIFATVESGLPTIFTRLPGLLMKEGGKLDEPFTHFAARIWRYVSDRINLEEKVEAAGMYFLLTGLGGAKYGWTIETVTVEEEEEVPITDENGQLVGTQVVTREKEVPIKEEPFVEVPAYDKIYFSPESEFVVDDTNNKIPYLICEYTKTPDEIEYEYKVKVPDKKYLDIKTVSSDLDLDKDPNLVKGDLERLSLYEYYGTLPKRVAGDPAWRPNQVYYSVFMAGKVLEKPKPFRKKPTVLIDNYRDPVRFFPFGEPRILRELEHDISLGRSRIMDIRDKYGTKIYLTKETEVDERALKNPADWAVLRGVGAGAPPQYLTPPPIPETLIMALEHSRQDVQMVSAQLDLSRGGTQTMVKTATGQAIFQQATEKRLDRKRKKLGRFIRALAKNVLTLCGENWDEERLSQITDVPVEEIRAAGFLEKLARLDELYDVELDIEDVTRNKETAAAQAIALYREVKDDPLVNREEALKWALKIGFDERNVERFLAKEVSPDTVMRVLGYLVDNQILPPEAAESLVLALRQTLPPEEGAKEMGRPQTADPVEVQKGRSPPADATQLNSQTASAYKQTGVPKGMQNT